MQRYVGSLLIGVIVGLAVGVYLGWERYPVRYTNSSMAALDPSYQEQYVVMVAEGYLFDGDSDAALERLKVLGKENVFDYIEDLTERYKSLSKDVDTIEKVTALCKALGRCTTLPD
jgi:hypothetical protein